jgi:hypothetical protein
MVYAVTVVIECDLELATLKALAARTDLEDGSME